MQGAGQKPPALLLLGAPRSVTHGLAFCLPLDPLPSCRRSSAPSRVPLTLRCLQEGASITEQVCLPGWYRYPQTTASTSPPCLLTLFTPPFSLYRGFRPRWCLKRDHPWWRETFPYLWKLLQNLQITESNLCWSPGASAG